MVVFLLNLNKNFLLYLNLPHRKYNKIHNKTIGPLLFTIFINYLPERPKNKCKLYADDCKLIGIVKDEGNLQEIQEDINGNG